MNSTVFKYMTQQAKEMTEEAKKFLHLSEGQKKWIAERLRNCPLSKMQCESKG